MDAQELQRRLKVDADAFATVAARAEREVREDPSFGYARGVAATAAWIADFGPSPLYRTDARASTFTLWQESVLASYIADGGWHPRPDVDRKYANGVLTMIWWSQGVTDWDPFHPPKAAEPDR